VVARPAVWLLSHATDLLVRLAGGDPRVQREEVTEEEVRDLVAAQASSGPEHRMILTGAFEIYESDSDVAGAQRQPDGSLVLPGGLPVHDLGDLG
jgi:CBS domain containing-hemolysin-like protein